MKSVWISQKVRLKPTHTTDFKMLDELPTGPPPRGGCFSGLLPVFVTIRMEYDELGKDIKILMG